MKVVKNINMKKKLVLILFLFMIISLINQYSAEFILNKYNNYFFKQIIWYIIFFALIFIVSKFNVNKLSKYFYLIYTINIILLVLVLFFGKEVNGSKAWFQFSFISIQPSELMKISLILILAILTRYKTKTIYMVLLTLLPSILTYLEPDTGSIMIYLVILASFFLMGRAKRKYLIISSLLIIISLSYLYIYYEDLFINIFGVSFYYRIERITSFINQSGMQLENSLIVISNSNLFNFNYNKLSLYFPEAPTDFVFTLTANNLGILGVILLIILYIIFIYYLIKLCLRSTGLKKYISFAYIFLIAFQIIYNIYMCLGLLPIVGIPLPFISYGGSSLITSGILIGIICSKGMNRDNN